MRPHSLRPIFSLFQPDFDHNVGQYVKIVRLSAQLLLAQDAVTANILHDIAVLAEATETTKTLSWR